jgi:hypothetical protein
MLASELISRSLRLINEPGRGATLDPADQSDALTALIEVLDSESVSKQFIPGVSRHFYSMISGKSIYTYGAGSGADLRSDDFGSLRSGLGDPAPVTIEFAFIRSGTVINDNEIVDEFRFEATGTWSLDSDPDVKIVNNQFSVEQPAGATASSQVLVGLTAGRDYVLRVDAEVFNGDIDIQLRDSAAAFQTFTIDSSGFFDFVFTWPSVVAPDINLVTDLATDDIRFNSISLIEEGKRDRLELPDSRGSDYTIRIIDQTQYNRRFTKGTGGRPYQLFYNRAFDEIGELRFDNSAITGDILVLNVLTNRAAIRTVNDTIRLNPEGIKWLRYALADHIAPEYGKELTRRQIIVMNTAWDLLAASNTRINTLGVDRALRNRPTFDINRGDP